LQIRGINPHGIEIAGCEAGDLVLIERANLSMGGHVHINYEVHPCPDGVDSATVIPSRHRHGPSDLTEIIGGGCGLDQRLQEWVVNPLDPREVFDEQDEAHVFPTKRATDVAHKVDQLIAGEIQDLADGTIEVAIDDGDRGFYEFRVPAELRHEASSPGRELADIYCLEGQVTDIEAPSLITTLVVTRFTDVGDEIVDYAARDL
jgi:hypothetical protein